MRHAKKYRRLNRTSGHRQSLLRNMVSSLIRHDRIKTTLPKAKEVRKFADKVSRCDLFNFCVDGFKMRY